jgi:membrane dipeptidase
MRCCLSAVISIACVVTLGCAGSDRPRGPESDLESAARSLAQEALIVDTHLDLPYRLMEKMEDISRRTEGGHFDYPRREGGLNAPFMSIYTPVSYQETGGAKEYADKFIDLVEKLTTDWPDKFAVARSPADLREHFQGGLISFPLGMENGAPIEDDLANLAHFFNRGIRYITLAHSNSNQICDSSFSEERVWGGLSPFGEEVVREMNRLGIMIDVSHVTDESARQVLEISKAPAIASHSSCRSFTPGWERNMSDELIELLAAGGGVIHINFGSAFLVQDANEQSTAFWDSFDAYIEEHGLDYDDERARQYRERYWNENPRIYADVTDVVAHIDHVVRLVGVDHVGLGSDFDGLGDSLPTGLKDVSQYPNIIRALLDERYSEDDVRKILGGNLLRVWSEVERVAQEIQASR